MSTVPAFPPDSQYWTLPPEKRQEFINRLYQIKRQQFEERLVALKREVALGWRREWCPQKPFPRQKLFIDFRDDRSDVTEMLFGGAAGPGKSSALLMAALQDVHVSGYAALLLRRTFTDLSLPDSLMFRAKEWLAPAVRDKSVKWNEQRHMFTFPSGATLTFGYLDTENDKLQYQSAAFQFVGFDELTQFTETMYVYLFSRLRRHKTAKVPLRLLSASNPGGEGAEWVKARFIPDSFIPADANEPRVWPKIGFDDQNREVRRFFVPARFTDNPALDINAYRLSLSRLDRVTRTQLEEGDWSIIDTGRMRFDVEALAFYTPLHGEDGELFLQETTGTFYQQATKEPYFAPREGGLLSLWRKPFKGHFYVIGADPAEGRDINRGKGRVDPDYSVANVRDYDTRIQVARFRGRIPESAFGEYLYYLGRFYSWAYIVLEVTGGHGQAAMDKLIDLGYPLDLIYHERYEDRAYKPRKEELGWRTTLITRPQLISHLDNALIEHSIETFDPITIAEYRSFIINKDGKSEARAGTHDDCVFADALSIIGLTRAPRQTAERVQVDGTGTAPVQGTYSLRMRDRMIASLPGNSPVPESADRRHIKKVLLGT